MLLRRTRWVALVAMFPMPEIAAAQTEAEPPPDTLTDVAAAARAFANGQAAELRGEHEDAAAFYELAFHIAPTPQALRSAVREWHRAGVRSRAATLAERLASRYPDDPLTGQIAQRVLEETRGSLARYAIVCEPACALAVDGRAAEMGREAHHVVYVEPGAHAIEARFDDGRSVRREATVEAGASADLSLAPPPPAAQPPSPPPAPIVRRVPPDPLSFVPFTFLLGTTVALGGVTIGSAVEVATSETAQDEIRTHVLLGVTCASAVATAIVAAFTDWNGSETIVAPSISLEHAGVAVHGAIP